MTIILGMWETRMISWHEVVSTVMGGAGGAGGRLVQVALKFLGGKPEMKDLPVVNK